MSGTVLTHFFCFHPPKLKHLKQNFSPLPDGSTFHNGYNLGTTKHQKAVLTSLFDVAFRCPSREFARETEIYKERLLITSGERAWKQLMSTKIV